MTASAAAPGVLPTPPQHTVDAERLSVWMQRHVEGCSGPLEVRQFAGGQSNPTYLVQSAQRRYVLRRKPLGHLLPSAHAVEREFRVASALATTPVPVARMYALCEDPDVIGSAFYVMDYVDGRIFWDALLPEVRPEGRRAIYGEMIRVLAALHSVDPAAVGLSDFGKAGRYIERQLSRWAQQYRASETERIEAMEKLIDWLPRHIPAGDETCIVHGDFRLDNTIFHPSEPRILAVLDWELSTLGHPLVDFAYFCMRYRLPAVEFRGLGGVDAAAAMLPSEAQCVAEYCRLRGIAPVAVRDWAYYSAFCMFRMAGILQGILKRALQGNASSASALEAGRRARPLAEMGWNIVQQSFD